MKTPNKVRRGSKKRIRIAIVGSASISKHASRMLALAILGNLQSRYELREIITIEEDPIGRAIRKLADVPLKTYSERDVQDQEDAAALTAGAIFWATKNYILVHNGSYSWAEHLREIIDRHPSRKYKMLEIDHES